MYTADRSYVIRPDGSTHCVCYNGTPEQRHEDALETAAMKNEKMQRTPHPATEISPADLAFLPS